MPRPAPSPDTRSASPTPDTPSEAVPSPASSGDRLTVAAESFCDQDDIVTLDPTGSTTRYRPGEVLGEGGMGEVRLCDDERLRRQVAMKVMRKDKAVAQGMPAMRARFFQEAVAQGQLEHPAIVPVYDLGTDERGDLYFTMRRVVGATLEEVIGALWKREDGALREYTRNKLLAAFGNVCLAVHYAHTKGVLHCDLKPSNVMLGSYGEVYVLDWGLAVRADRAARDDRPSGELTAASAAATSEGGTVHGTPGYMAPEQIRGRALDCRADVYALGAILFELLTLEPLHDGKDARALCLSTLHGASARASVRAPMRDVPPELEAICVRATSLDAGERYASARAMHDDLQAYLEGDRDVHLRREMAHEHAARAVAMAKRVVSGDESCRSDAMQKIGRALALDPTNEGALGSLVDLLTCPPKKLPADAAADLGASERKLEGVRRRAAMLGYGAWFLCLPLMAAYGIKSLPMFVVSAVAWGAALLGNLLLPRRRDGYGNTSLVWLGGAAIATSSVIVGPNILTPTIAAIFGITCAFSMDKKRLYLPLVASLLAVAVPMLLERTGILPSSFSITPGGWTLASPMLEPPKSESGGLFVVNILCVTVACLVGASFRKRLWDLQRRAHINEWQLRQLLPKKVASLRPLADATTPPWAKR